MDLIVQAHANYNSYNMDSVQKDCDNNSSNTAKCMQQTFEYQVNTEAMAITLTN